ncbi:DUF2314 domain-containing protein [Geothrix alkalitolerans]|uniref:DUF2314 domain-containing protein n=1 Tax=Geothrix alkalitolerans TaxID=2922724 RepID=UPI001FB02B5E|nr:DUF2314 domain-containing protein [Geothrix alkalitolerans]
MHPSKFTIGIVCSVCLGLAGQTTLSPNAPQDKPAAVSTLDQHQKVWAAARPYVEKAKATWPQAKARFLAGLPKGQVFFITTDLIDMSGRHEYVFVEAHKITNTAVEGILASAINTVSGFRQGQKITIQETSIIDWLISHPDGHEEGNVVGLFLEQYFQQPH